MFDDDKDQGKYPLMAAPKKPSTATDKSYSSGSTSNSSSTYNSSSGYSTWTSTSNPKMAFKIHGIEFWGGSKFKIEDDIVLSDRDLVINCTGTSFSPKKPFVSKAPEWFSVSDKYLKESVVNQVLLEWKDMSPPPNIIELDFWEDIVRQCLKNNIKRVFCCCTAGQGRTGTALAALMLATGAVDEPSQAIDHLREHYNSKAVETGGQELYTYNLLYNVADFLKEIDDADDDDDDLPPEAGSTKTL